MDTITHSLLGALVVRSAFPAQRLKHPFSNRQRLLAGAVGGAFPDIDYIAAWVDPMVYLTLWHRSITHSFVMLPLWALLVGITLSFVFRQRREWRYLSMLTGVAVLSHIASDLITVYGTQVLAPLSSWRASIGTTFIIDPWFTLIVLIGFIAGFKKRPDKKDSVPAYRGPDSPGVYLVDKDFQQASIKVGFPGLKRPHPDYYKLSVASYIFGSGGCAARSCLWRRSVVSWYH